MRFMRLLIVPVVLFSLVQPLMAAPSPQSQVQETVETVLEILRDEETALDLRRSALSGLVRERFDFNIMSQRTLGKHWKIASVTEQSRFVALFSDLLEASYIGRIEAYTDEQVEFLGEQIKGDRAEVRTRVRNAKLDIPINYRLVLLGEQWFVYDVIIEDVSLIKNYRSSYGEIVRNEGFDGLFVRMEEKIRELRAGMKTNG